MRSTGLFIRACVVVGFATGLAFAPPFAARAQDVSQTKCLDFYPTDLVLHPGRPSDPAPDRCVSVLYGESPAGADGAGAQVYVPVEKDGGVQVYEAAKGTSQVVAIMTPASRGGPVPSPFVFYVRQHDAWVVMAGVVSPDVVSPVPGNLPLVVVVRQTHDKNGAPATYAYLGPVFGFESYVDGSCGVLVGGPSAVACPVGISVPWLAPPVLPLPFLP